MKKLLLITLSFLGSFSFGQYIKDGTFVLKDGSRIETIDIIYGNKQYQFVEKDVPYTFQTIKSKHVTEIIFDSVNFFNQVPKLKETFFDNDLPEGIYETIEDFYNKKPSSVEKIVGKEVGAKNFDRPRDLMTFKIRTDDKILKSAFAVVYNNDLFFNKKAISNNSSKNLKRLPPINAYNEEYIRVKFKNDNYYYTDAPIINNDNTYMMMGGLVGGLAQAIVNSKETKISAPIILLNSEKKFYSTMSCKVFNELFNSSLDLEIICDKKDNLDIISVRKKMIDNENK